MSNEAIAEHIITNPVPTPEEMAERLGIGLERVAALRLIMTRPISKRGVDLMRKHGFSPVEQEKKTRAKTQAKTKGLNAKAAAR